MQLLANPYQLGGLKERSEISHQSIPVKLVNVLNYIELPLLKPNADLSKSAHKKFNICKSALTAYNEKRLCNLDNVILSDFLFDFGKFLAIEKTPNYSPSTIRDILRTLRPFLRSAISEGYVPNIDVIPSVIQALDKEVWPEATADKKQSSSVIRQDLQVRESVRAMMKHLDIWSTRQKMDNGRKNLDRDERTEALQNRCVAIYLFCLLTYGITIKDALAIKRDWEGQELPDSVYVERYGMRLNLTSTAKSLVKLYNKDSVCTEHLFFTLDNKKYNDDLDNAAKLIEGHVIKYLAQHKIPLYKKRSVFIDWLNYIIESGVPESEVEILWQHHITNALKSATNLQFDAVQSKLNKQDDMLDESWYLLCIIPLSIKRKSFFDILLSSGILGNENDSRKRIYMPEENVKKERGESAVFSRYIFFRGTQGQAKYISGYSPYAYVLKDKAKNQFARISEKEIKSLQIMLRDFPDAVELVDGERWLKEHNAKITKGTKAIIRSGALAGKEATIVDFKGSNVNKRTYIIEYIDGTIKFNTNLAGIELDIIEE